MSDNVKDELGFLVTGYWTRASEANREALIGDLLAHLAERGMVVLGPDGEPLDVRPALRALAYAERHSPGHLELFDITGPLADACLAAAEVEPS